MVLADYIRQFCAKHNVSITKLAQHAGISRNTLYELMGDSQPTIKVLCKLAVAMQVHPSFLLNLEWQKCKLDGIEATPLIPLPNKSTHLNSLEDNSNFISETIPDGSLVVTNEHFSKTWRLQNTGEVVWENRKLVCQNNYEDIEHQSLLKKFSNKRSFFIKPLTNSIDIPLTLPGETVDLTVEFIAPDVAAQVFSYWKMTYADHSLCFPDSIGVYLQVQVI